jgi:hypothetical protein
MNTPSINETQQFRAAWRIRNRVWLLGAPAIVKGRVDLRNQSADLLKKFRHGVRQGEVVN